MFHLDQFISQYVTKRPVSMFSADIEATRDALTAVLGEEALEPATQEAMQAQLDQIGAMMDTHGRFGTWRALTGFTTKMPSWPATMS